MDKESIKQLFRNADTNGDGKIQREELLGVLLKACGQDVTEDEFHELFEDCDRNGDGVLDYSEFLDYVFENEEDPDDLTGQVLEVLKNVPETAEKSADSKFEVFRAHIEEAMDAETIPGVAFVLSQNGDIVYEAYLGTRDQGSAAPVTSDTLFHAGSTFKAINGMLLAILVDEGVIAWDTPIADIVPGIDNPDFTMYNLANMSSGLNSDAFDGEFDEESCSVSDLLNFVVDMLNRGEEGTLFPANTRHSYCNIAISLCGYAAAMRKNEATEWSDEVLTQYRQLVQEKILTPLSMDRCKLLASEMETDPDHAVPHDEDGCVKESCDKDGDSLAPSGGMKATARDMMKFVQCQLCGGGGMVSIEGLQKTWEPNTSVLEYDEEDDGAEGEPCQYAVGWEVGDGYISHTGSYDSMTSVIAMLPEQNVGLVLLKNTDNGDELLDSIVALTCSFFRGQESTRKTRRRKGKR